jgi:isopentenyl phosphate kinase
VIESLLAEQIPAISFPPSAGVMAHNGRIQVWNLEPLQAALDNGLVPVIYGDVVFDTAIGGTILSTEDLFLHLVSGIWAERILLAGIEPGVWADFPQRKKLIEQITTENFAQNESGIKGSSATDVTGGMRQKVEQMLAAVQENHGMQVLIFSGETPGTVQAALAGKTLGTVISE